MIAKAITEITGLSKTIVTGIVIKKIYTITDIQQAFKKYRAKSTFFSNVCINNFVFLIGAFYLRIES